MRLITKIKQYPSLGLVLLAFIAFVGLGMPDGLLGFYLLASRQSNNRKGIVQ